MNPQRSEPNALICPLCQNDELMEVDQLTGGQLKKLWKAWGREFSDEAWSNIPENFSVILRECQQCHFSFFDGSLAGRETFYRELEHENYFCPTRPEFARTVTFAGQKKLKRILDVGCGSGAFLDLAKQSGHEVAGVELNKVAAGKARAKGHTVFEELLDHLDLEKTSGGYDLITLFQVLEHVPNPVTILKEAARLLNAGGYISVAVPSAQGIYRIAPYDPHQWPPHHISRWRIADFHQLSRAINMKLVESGGDILLGKQIEELSNLHNHLAPIIGKRKHRGEKVMPIISFIYRKTGLKHIFPKWGSSIYGHFQKR